MPTLYYGSGSQSYSVGPPSLSDGDWARNRTRRLKILAARNQTAAITLLEQLPWRVHQGENDFNDPFEVLYAHLDTDRYIDACELAEDAAVRAAARTLAQTYGEVGLGYIRFVGFGLTEDEEAPEALPPAPTVTSASVRRALEDAEILLSQGRPSSALDRAHTALHAYLAEHARHLGIDVGAGATHLAAPALYKRIRKTHPAFLSGPHAEHAAQVAQTLALVVDRMDTLRNNASNAHPNDEVLDAPEAQLAISAVWTLLRYLDARLSPLE